MQDQATPAMREILTVQIPKELVCLHLPPRQLSQRRRSTSTHTDRLVLAVASYASRPLPEATVRDRCRSWFGFSDRRVKAALRRLQADGAIVARANRIHILRSYRQKAKDCGGRFVFTSADLARFQAGELSATEAGLLALLRTRGARWADSDEHLAKLMGAARSRIQQARSRLVAAGDLAGVSSYRLKTGHRLTSWKPTADAATETPSRATETPRDALETQSGTSQNSHLRIIPATPPQVAARTPEAPPAAAMIQNPKPSLSQSGPTWKEELAEAQRRNRKLGEDVGSWRHGGTNTAPIWQQQDDAEDAAMLALRSWRAFEDGMEQAVRKLHYATGVDAIFLALTAAGVFVLPRRITAAGKLGLRRKRMELAEELQRQLVQPSTLLEAAHKLKLTAKKPHDVGAKLRRTLLPKDAELIERRRAGEALPMAAGIDALNRLIRPQTRDVGSHAYPSQWWSESATDEALERLEDTKEVLATLRFAMGPRDEYRERARAQLRKLCALGQHRGVIRLLEDELRL